MHPSAARTSSLSRRGLLLAAIPLQAAETFVRVSRRDPRYLELSDGAPYTPIGLNLIAPPGRDTAAGLRVHQGWLDKLASNGGNYGRAWLSNAKWSEARQADGHVKLPDFRRPLILHAG